MIKLKEFVLYINIFFIMKTGIMYIYIANAFFVFSAIYESIINIDYRLFIGVSVSISNITDYKCLMFSKLLISLYYIHSRYHTFVYLIFYPLNIRPLKIL